MPKNNTGQRPRPGTVKVSDARPYRPIADTVYAAVNKQPGR